MADTILSNGVRLIAGADEAWKPSTDINLTLFNTLIGRVLILESQLNGDVIGGYTQVPSGVSTSALQALINAGGILVLPNETITQTAVLRFTNDVTILGHPGGLSELRINGNMSVFGQGAQLYIGWDFSEYPDLGPPADPAINVVMRGFTVSHSRSDPDTRMSAMMLKDGIASLEVAYMRFEDITADVVTHSASSAGTDLDLHNVSFHDNVVAEWYESVFISRNGSLTNAWIYNNTCTTTAPNPNGSISRPYGFILDEEGSTGFRSDIVIANNIVDARGSNPANMGNSFGLAVTLNDTPGPCSYNRVTFQNNKVYNFFYGVYMNGVTDQVAHDAPWNKTSFITFENNRIEDSLSTPIAILMQARDEGPLAHAGDRLILANNHCINGGGGSAIVIDIAATPAYTVHDIGNTSVGF